MIRIEHLYKKYRKISALHDISVQIDSGRVLALTGPNGSGKTTLIKSVLGMVRPDSGKIYFGTTLVSKDYSYRNRIGYMPQIGRYPDNMKVKQVIDMIRDIRRVPPSAIDPELFEAYEIGRIGDKSMQSLSGGTRQKISAVIAFMFGADFLILDEPTAGLDPVASEILKEKIQKEKERGKSIVITSHILSDLEQLATDIMYLHEGKTRFIGTVPGLKDITGESRLGSAIAKLMKDVTNIPLCIV